MVMISRNATFGSQVIDLICRVHVVYFAHCENSGTCASGATPMQDQLEMHDMYVALKNGGSHDY